MKLLNEQATTKSKALLFDIKKFALHDGLGIRTTLFFKGCPLRCAWCHNPEGLSVNRQVIYLENKCIHCKECIKASQNNELIYQNNRPYILNQKINLDHIVNACPTTALRYDSQYYHLNELIQIIEEDKIFYGKQGGVTFSGGEPLLQASFINDLIDKCKERSIHTAIETSGNVSFEIFKMIIDKVDQIYLDLKLFDSIKHKYYTGKENKQILENIKYVLTSKNKEKVIIRIPLIPGINDDEENLKESAQFLLQYNPEVEVELLNYNPLAKSKYEMVNLSYILNHIQPLSEEIYNQKKAYMKEIGIKKCR